MHHVWGLSTRRLLLRHVRPQHNITYLPSYVGTHPATYGVCQHAGYSYDTCDLNTISHISPHTSGRTRPRMGFVDTLATPTTRVTSQAYLTVRFGPGYILTSHLTVRFGPGYILTSHLTIRFGPSYILTSPHRFKGLNTITIWGVRGVVRIALQGSAESDTKLACCKAMWLGTEVPEAKEMPKARGC
ncbi:unnamed protein product [Prunus armeniaca]